MTAARQSENHRETQAGTLLHLAESIGLFRTPEGEAYAEIPVDGHTEIHPLKSKAIKDWLTFQYDNAYDGAPNKTAMEGALAVLESRARFKSAEQEIHLRLASAGDILYLDLGNEAREVVKITPVGWTIEKSVPVRFRRSKSMQALPRPERNGNINELRQFLNVATDTEWILMLAWLIGAFHPTGPYPVLALHGEKGSAKSTTTRYLRALIDPSTAMAPVQSSNSQDLTIKAHHNWIVAFDNMSSMPRWLSDGLCRLSTGASDSKRELYADSEEVVFKAKRPCIINGIEELATAGDLLDRTILVTLPVISEGQRASESSLDRRFEEARPRLLGGLLDVLVVALGNYKKAQLPSKPRLADFAMWMVAAETTLGWKSGTFMATYTGNRDDANRLEIEASPVAMAVYRFAEERKSWSGTATDLRTLLLNYVDPKSSYSPYWPANGKALSGKLNRVAGALRGEGVKITLGHSGSRSITIHYVGKDNNNKENQNPDGNAFGVLDAPDANNPSFPIYSFEKKEERDIGKPENLASFASIRPSVIQSAEDFESVVCYHPDIHRQSWVSGKDACCPVCVAALDAGIVGAPPRWTQEQANACNCEDPENHYTGWRWFKGQTVPYLCGQNDCIPF